MHELTLAERRRSPSENAKAANFWPVCLLPWIQAVMLCCLRKSKQFSKTRRPSRVPTRTKHTANQEQLGAICQPNSTTEEACTHPKLARTLSRLTTIPSIKFAVWWTKLWRFHYVPFHALWRHMACLHGSQQCQ